MDLGSGVAVSCGVSCRCSSDPEFLSLWCRPAAAALIGPLVWELPYAAGVALNRQKDQKNVQQEFLLWLSGLGTQHNVPEVSGLIPGLTQWVKNHVGCRCGGLNQVLPWP